MPDEISFTRPLVKRGRITNYRTHISLEFLFNPTSIDEKKGNNWNEDPIPGFSDPIIRWNSGKAQQFSFKLEIDGEMRLRRPSNLPQSVIEKPDIFNRYSINNELAWLDSLQYPAYPGAAASASTEGPDRVILNIGSRYPGALCVVEDVGIKIQQFNQNLDPSKAEVTLMMKRITFTQRWSNMIWTNEESEA